VVVVRPKGGVSINIEKEEKQSVKAPVAEERQNGCLVVVTPWTLAVWWASGIFGVVGACGGTSCISLSTTYTGILPCNTLTFADAIRTCLPALPALKCVLFVMADCVHGYAGRSLSRSIRKRITMLMGLGRRGAHPVAKSYLLLPPGRSKADGCVRRGAQDRRRIAKNASLHCWRRAEVEDGLDYCLGCGRHGQHGKQGGVKIRLRRLIGACRDRGAPPLLCHLPRALTAARRIFPAARAAGLRCHASRVEIGDRLVRAPLLRHRTCTNAHRISACFRMAQRDDTAHILAYLVAVTS